MAGVYIPDMKMPESCFQCMFRAAVDPETILCLVSRKRFEERFSHFQHRDKSCPLCDGDRFNPPAPVSEGLTLYPVDPDFVKDVQQDPPPDFVKTWAEYLAEAGVPLPSYERAETEKQEGGQ